MRRFPDSLKQRRIAILTLLSAIAFAFLCSCSDYRFEVVKNISHVYVNRDGSIDIEYFLTFCNRGKTIDVVDVGFPHPGYKLESVTAEVDGEKVTRIKKSGYIPVGVEIHLGEKFIRKGQTATVHVKGNNPAMVFADTENSDYASVQFSPTWFSPDFVIGLTHLEVNIHLPTGVEIAEARWSRLPPAKAGYDENGRFTYTWVQERAAQGQYLVGVSFPRKYIPAESVSPPFAFPGFFEGVSEKGSSWLSTLEGLAFPGLFYGLIAAVGVIGWAVKRRSKMRYFPPSVSIEGMGVKKDLSPAEAAVVMELPLSRIAAVALHGLVEKGIIRVDQIHPLRVTRLVETLPPLADYELEALKALQAAKPQSREDRLSEAMVQLVRSVRQKIRGYDRRATCNYYKEMVESAWNRLKTSEASSHLVWLMLDDKLSKKLQESPDKNSRFDELWRERYRSGDSISYPIYRHSEFDYFLRTLIPDNRSFTESVTKVTNPAAFATGGIGGGGGGGYGGFCACACAGCACACAGGGR
jgi:hypothetical protein